MDKFSGWVVGAGLTLAFIATPVIGLAQDPPPPPTAGQPAPESKEAFEARQSPVALMEIYVRESRWESLEALIHRVVRTDMRTTDGVPFLYTLVFRFEHRASRISDAEAQQLAAKLQAYAKAYPESALAATLPAVQMGASAWRARGKGYASTVTPEGRQMYLERIERAWDMLMEARAHGSRLPSWYQWAIKIGLDSGRSANELLPILSEGVRRHPGQFTIYYPYLRTFTPLWGGDYSGAATFISAAVASPTNTHGERLYAYLAWKLDYVGGDQPSFFEDSGVDWARMRKGFEEILEATNEEPYVRAAFASFACRARDRETYYRELKALPDPAYVESGMPQWLTPEICDARFLKKP